MSSYKFNLKMKFPLNFNLAHQSFARFNQRSIHAVHLVIKSTSIAQVVAGSVASPQWSANRTAIHALPTFTELKVHCTFYK